MTGSSPVKQQELIYREHETEQQQELTLLFWGESHPAFEDTLAIFFRSKNLLLKKMPFQQLLIGEDLDSPLSNPCWSFRSDSAIYHSPRTIAQNLRASGDYHHTGCLAILRRLSGILDAKQHAASLYVS